VQKHAGKDEIDTIIVFLRYSLLVHHLHKLRETGRCPSSLAQRPTHPRSFAFLFLMSKPSFVIVSYALVDDHGLLHSYLFAHSSPLCLWYGISDKCGYGMVRSVYEIEERLQQHNLLVAGEMEAGSSSTMGKTEHCPCKDMWPS
jgi:hypothetical protein